MAKAQQQSSWITSCYLILIIVIFSNDLGIVSSQEYCGVKEPNVDQLCVSLRLPWQAAPIYFCTDKGKVNYRKKCRSSGQYCPSQPENTLQISTPWDCCPLTSQPDPCANTKCPPAPFNRTCTEYFTDNYWDCCPHYFCEEGNRELCHIKKLEPGCTSHTKETGNCTGFIDPHGCCNKYQCEQDTKPGACPTIKHHRYIGTPLRVVTAQMNITDAVVKEEDKALNSSSPLQFPPTGFSVVSFGALQQCVGDYTCPNAMKCCSTTDHVSGGPFRGSTVSNKRAPPGKISYYHHQQIRNDFVHGYCMEPVLENQTQSPNQNQ